MHGATTVPTQVTRVQDGHMRQKLALSGGPMGFQVRMIKTSSAEQARGEDMVGSRIWDKKHIALSVEGTPNINQIQLIEKALEGTHHAWIPSGSWFWDQELLILVSLLAA